FLNAQLPTRFTPFPYTTLFRSAVDRLERRRRDDGAVGVRAVVHRGLELLLHHADDGEGQVVEHDLAADGVFGAEEALGHVGPQEDRKSTRLNSSHVKISYAVFC